MDEVVGFIFGLVLVTAISTVIPDAAVTPLEYNAATTLCSGNEGVLKVRGSGFITSTNISCANGAKFKVDWEQLKKFKD